MTPTNLYLFVGPTAYGIDEAVLRQPGIQVLPPIRRGGMEELVERVGTPGTVAIVDGTFHSYPSVGHAEIRMAVENGWAVWGLSSMGAIRAAEMRHLGVRGYGEVYRWYASDEDVDDDEVTLVHTAEPPHRPLSEPLVHIRRFIADLTVKGRFGADEAGAIVDSLKNRWYGDRTLHALRVEIAKHSQLADDVVERELHDFGRYRLKEHDLVTFLNAREWRTDD